MRGKVEEKRSAISTGDPAKGQEMIRTTIWLPQQMHQRLKQIGGAGGASEEIRKRLEASEKVPADPKTRELLSAISFVADKAGMYFGNWSEDPFAFETLKAAVDLWLTANRPKGEPVMKPNPNREPFDSFFASDTSPENIARLLLANLMWLNREDEGKRR
jgi:hypothetical protein